jgi:hypothetical protein
MTEDALTGDRLVTMVDVPDRSPANLIFSASSSKS